MDLHCQWDCSNRIFVSEGHNTLKLGSYVGYLESPHGETIEVLPKTCLGHEDVFMARKTLQTMLASALNIKPREAGPAGLLRRDMPLHEWIFSQFLTQLSVLVVQGLRFHYERQEEVNPFIRGQLMLQRQQRLPPGREHLFNISHDVFSANRIENRLLKTALLYVAKACRAPDNWRRANELNHRLAEIPPLPNPMLFFQRWQNSKLMQRYEQIKPWSRIILETLNPIFQKGTHQGISLMFPMEQLFEKHVEICLQHSLSQGAKLKSQASSLYLVKHSPTRADTDNRDWFQLKPDLLLINKGGAQVLDTKWKLLDMRENTSEHKYKMAQSDLYQLFAYGQKYQNGKGHMMLIYPSHEHFDHPLPAFFFTDQLILWVVPFCLQRGLLVEGDWKTHFTSISRTTLKQSNAELARALN